MDTTLNNILHEKIQEFTTTFLSHKEYPFRSFSCVDWLKPLVLLIWPYREMPQQRVQHKKRISSLVLSITDIIDPLHVDPVAVMNQLLNGICTSLDLYGLQSNDIKDIKLQGKLRHNRQYIRIDVNL